MIRREWFIEIDAIQRDMERFLERFSGLKPPSIRFLPSLWEPPVDVYETEDSLFVVAEIPGIGEDDVEILLEGNNLILKGERKEGREEDVISYHRMEIARGPFERRITLPFGVNPDDVEISYDKGLLKIKLPKLKEEKTYKVRIKK